MRLSCLQENLSRGLSIVGRAVATRTTLPITQNVLMSTDQKFLKLSATNLEIAISTWIRMGNLEEEGAITVPARMLTEFVSSLPPKEIEVDSTTQPNVLALKCARFKANINGTEAEEFPPIPTVESGVVATVEPGILREAISHVAFAAATEDSRPVLTGIKVEMSGSDFTFAAADGFRLAVFKQKLASAVDEDLSFIVPARALQEVNRLIGTQQEPIEFMVTPSKSQVLFRLDGVEIVSQLIQGTFPNYSQLIPEGYEARVMVEQSAFLSATRTASIFARDGSGIVKLQASVADGASGHLTVSSRAEELGDNQGVIDATVEGDKESKIAFNVKYLAEVLDVLGDGQVALELTTPNSPGVLRRVNNDSYTHVVMPMFVQW